MFVADLYRNETQSRNMVHVVNELLKEVGKYKTVVVCVNGTDVSDAPVDWSERIQKLYNDFPASDRVQLVINLGNHEFMHPKEVTATLGALVAGGRTHVVSNIDPGNGPLLGLVRPFVAIANMTFVGYCTGKIFRDPRCRIARDKGYFVGDEPNHSARFKESIQNVRTPVLVVLSDGTRNESSVECWPQVLKYCSPQTIHRFVALRGSPEFSKDCQDSQFEGAKRVFYIPPFGRGAGILRLYKKNSNEEISCYCETPSFWHKRLEVVPQTL
jgi:hypothetical protein